MALCGVSSSDLKVFGVNTAVCAGVVLGCAAIAWTVKQIAIRGFTNYTEVGKDKKSKPRVHGVSSLIGTVAGALAAVAVYKFLPVTIVTNDSNSKAAIVGAVETVAGLILDGFSPLPSIAAVVGFSGAAATRFGKITLPVFGTVGAAIGASIIQSFRKNKENEVF